MPVAAGGNAPLPRLRLIFRDDTEVDEGVSQIEEIVPLALQQLPNLLEVKVLLLYGDVAELSPGILLVLQDVRDVPFSEPSPPACEW